MDEQTPLRGTPPPDDELNATDENAQSATADSPHDVQASSDDLNGADGFAPDLDVPPADPLEWQAVTPPSGVTPVGSTAALDDVDFDYTPPSGSIPADPHAPTSDHPHRGRARERIAKRKQQRGEAVPAASRPPSVRNAPPRERIVRDPSSVVTRGITTARSAAGAAVRGAARGMPDTPQIKLRLPVSRVGLYLLGSFIFIIVVVVALGVARNRPVAAMPNALFIGTEWTYEPKSENEVAALVDRLRTHQIGTVYAWVSWLQPDGTWRGQANFENVQAFVKSFHDLYPEAELYGWVSFPVETDGDYRMDDAAIQQTVADFSLRVVDEFGFDAVFLNIEPVWNNDEHFISMLRTVRNTVGDDIKISTAVPPDWSPIGAGIPVPPLIVPGTVWETNYKQNVALLVDQLVVMAYNSGLNAPTDYTQWVAYQVKTFADTIHDLNVGTEVIIGIPTYDAEPPGHDPLVENVITAVEGIKIGLEEAGETRSTVRGVALYAGWVTDDQEWADFLNTWVRE